MRPAGVLGLLALWQGAAVLLGPRGRLILPPPRAVLERLFALGAEGAFADTWTLAGERANERLNSFNGFREPAYGSERIDWVLARGAVKVSKVEVVDCRENGQYASDHFPVMAWLEIDRRSSP